MFFRGLNHHSLQIIWLFFVLLALNGCSGSFNQTETVVVDPVSITETFVKHEETQVAAITTTPTNEICTSQTGHLIDASVPSKILTTPIALKVYIPPCYDKTSSARYPVLYMLHGQTYSNDQWVRLGITTIANKLITEKRIDPLIIVMPNEDTSTSGPTTSKFGDAVVSEVIPWVDAHLNTCTERDCRAIGGLSRGGNWAVRIGLSNWQLFTAIGAHSTPLFFGDLTHIEKWVEQAPSLEDVPTIFMDMGKSDENRKAILQFESELSSLGVVHDFYQFVGFHEEKYWSAHIEEYLRWYSVHLSTGNK